MINHFQMKRATDNNTTFSWNHPDDITKLIILKYETIFLKPTCPSSPICLFPHLTTSSSLILYETIENKPNGKYIYPDKVDMSYYIRCIWSLFNDIYRFIQLRKISTQFKRVIDNLYDL